MCHSDETCLLCVSSAEFSHPQGLWGCTDVQLNMLKLAELHCKRLTRWLWEYPGCFEVSGSDPAALSHQWKCLSREKAQPDWYDRQWLWRNVFSRRGVVGAQISNFFFFKLQTSLSFLFKIHFWLLRSVHMSDPFYEEVWLKWLQRLHFHSCIPQKKSANAERTCRRNKSPFFPWTQHSVYVADQWQSVVKQPKNSVCCITDVIEVVAALLCRKRGKTRPSVTIFRETDTQAPTLRLSSVTQNTCKARCCKHESCFKSFDPFVQDQTGKDCEKCFCLWAVFALWGFLWERESRTCIPLAGVDSGVLEAKCGLNFLIWFFTLFSGKSEHLNYLKTKKHKYLQNFQEKFPFKPQQTQLGSDFYSYFLLYRQS